MPLTPVPHNLKTEVLSWPFPSRTVVPLEDNKTVVLLSTRLGLGLVLGLGSLPEEINADNEKEKLLLPVFHWFSLYANLTRCFLYPEILDGGHTESSYNVSTGDGKPYQRDLNSCGNVFGFAQSTSTSIDTVGQ